MQLAKHPDEIHHRNKDDSIRVNALVDLQFNHGFEWEGCDVWCPVWFLN